MSNYSLKSKLQDKILDFYTSASMSGNNRTWQQTAVCEERRWAVGGFRLRVRSSSVCGTVHGRWFLNRTHTPCSPCPFYLSHFPNVPVLCPGRAVRWRARGHKRWAETSKKQPSTPWDNISTHAMSPELHLKVSRWLREQVYAGWIQVQRVILVRPRKTIHCIIDTNNKDVQS